MKRQPNEPYDKYRERRTTLQKALKVYLRGRLWWDSAIRGTYVRKSSK